MLASTTSVVTYALYYKGPRDSVIWLAGFQFFFRVIVISLLIFIRRERTRRPLGLNSVAIGSAMPSGAGCLTCQRSALMLYGCWPPCQEPRLSHRDVSGDIWPSPLWTCARSQLVMFPRLRGKVAPCHHSASTPVTSSAKTPKSWMVECLIQCFSLHMGSF